MAAARTVFTCAGLALSALLTFFASPAAAQGIVADLSNREIAITTGFTGEDLLLFGTTEGRGDIVVTVLGPRRNEVVRRKERVAGIWINGEAMTFGKVPVYYRVAATRPLDKIAGEKELARMQLGESRLVLPAVGNPPPGDVPVFRAGLIRNKQRQELYGSRVRPITVYRDKLFRVSIPFPANVPIGRYLVTVHLFRDGKLVNQETTPLTVRKVGVEAQIFDFAYDHSAWYGAIAIVIALVAGWFAGVIFRRT